jgi:hypothetical protein
MAIRAAIDLLDDKTDSPWMGVLAIDPIRRRSTRRSAISSCSIGAMKGIEFYRKAVRLKPDLWSAHSQLGINLMRLAGAGSEAGVETAFNSCTDKPPPTRST